MKLPAWLRRETLKLPPWAKRSDSPRVKAGAVSISLQADTDAAFLEWFELLGVKTSEVTQYWLEVAYQCAKMDLQRAIEGSEYDPRTSGKPAEFRFTRANHWAQKNFPAGRGPLLASKGLEAREHYKKIRGRLPF